MPFFPPQKGTNLLFSLETAFVERLIQLNKTEVLFDNTGDWERMESYNENKKQSIQFTAVLFVLSMIWSQALFLRVPFLADKVSWQVIFERISLKISARTSYKSAAKLAADLAFPWNMPLSVMWFVF